MGRITIFSIEECNFCRRTKAALTARDIPYTNINIAHYPEKRSHMLSLTDRLTVPQVFFNDVHIGGAEETLDLLNRWDEEIAHPESIDETRERVVRWEDLPEQKKQEPDKTPRERYVRLIESQPDPKDERLAIPTGPPAVNSNTVAPPRKEEPLDINGKPYAFLDLMKLLLQRMPCSSLSYRGKVYYNSFKGSDGVAALIDIFQLKNKGEAVQLGLILQRKKFLDHVCEDHIFGDNSFYYRLQPFQKPAVLNSFRVWDDRVDPKTPDILHRLKKLWGKIETRHLDEEGLVDYVAMKQEEDYWKFEEEVCELQGVSLHDMDDDSKTAFVINLYNLMIKFAFVKVGIPQSDISRSAFFDNVSVDVGGDVFSFSALENGLLRSNARPPYHLFQPFGINDARRKLILPKVDCRIHFALNCGAKSCPPVKNYTAQAIEEELRLVALAFCEQDENVYIDEDNREIQLSKIFNWYLSDFAGSKSELPRKIVVYLRGKKREALEDLIAEGKISVKFADYDWSTNDCNSVPFSKGVLDARAAFPFARNPSGRMNSEKSINSKA